MSRLHLKSIARFTIRELLLLIGVIGLCIGWWRDHKTLTLHVRQLEYQSYRATETMNYYEETLRSDGWSITKRDNGSVGLSRSRLVE